MWSSSNKEKDAAAAQCVICTRSFVPPAKGSNIMKFRRPEDVQFIVERCLGGTWNSEDDAMTSMSRMTPASSGVRWWSENLMCPTHQEIISEGQRLEAQLASLKHVLETLKSGVKQSVIKSLAGEEERLKIQQVETQNDNDKGYWKLRKMFHDALAKNNELAAREERVIMSQELFPTMAVAEDEGEKDLMPDDNDVKIFGKNKVPKSVTRKKTDTGKKPEALSSSSRTVEVYDVEEFEVELVEILNSSVLEEMKDYKELVDPLLDTIKVDEESAKGCSGDEKDNNKMMSSISNSKPATIVTNTKCEVIGEPELAKTNQFKVEVKKNPRSFMAEIANDLASKVTPVISVSRAVAQSKEIVQQEKTVEVETPKVAVGGPQRRANWRERQCPYCFKLFETTKGKLKHIRTVHPEKTTCTFCNKRLKTPQALIRHHIRHQTADKPVSVSCDICNKTFQTNALMISHRGSHDLGDKTPIQCDQGGESLKKHVNQVHSQHPKDKHPTTTLTDLNCDKDKANDRAVSHRYPKSRRHLKRPSTAVTCEQCGKKLADNSSLKNHMASQHLRSFRFPCELCPTKCLFKSHLEAHMRAAHPTYGDVAKVADKFASIAKKVIKPKNA